MPINRRNFLLGFSAATGLPAMSGVTMAQVESVVSGALVPDGLGKIPWLTGVADLRATASPIGLTVDLQGYHAAGDGGGGRWYADQADDSTPDDGISAIVDAGGMRWKPIRQDFITYQQAGAKMNGETGDADVISDVWEYAAARGLEVRETTGGVLHCDKSLVVPSSGRLMLRNSPKTIFKAADTLDALVQLAALDELVIEGGVFDADGNISGANTYLFDGDANSSDGDTPLRFILRGSTVTGNAGNDQNVQGGAFSFRNSSDNSPRWIEITDSLIDGLDNSTGDGVMLQGPIEGSEPLCNLSLVFERNIMRNFRRGIYTNEARYQRVNYNTFEKIVNPLTLRSRRFNFDDTGEALDPGTPYTVQCNWNTIDSTDPSCTSTPVTIGYGASPVAVIGNDIYGNANVARGITLDAILSGGQSSEGTRVRTRSRVMMNNIKGTLGGIACNGGYEVIADNVISCQPGGTAISMRGEKKAVYGNFCIGAPIEITHPTGGAGAQPLDVWLGDNVFIDVEGSTVLVTHTAVTGRRMAGRAIAESASEAASGLASLHDLVALDTTGGSASISLPHTDMIGPNQLVAYMHRGGGNGITVTSRTRLFSNSVNTSANTITLDQNLYPQWETGRPVQVRLKGPDALPSGLAEKTVYYLIVVDRDANEIALAASREDAENDTRVSLSDAGDAQTKDLGDMIYDLAGDPDISMTISDPSRPIRLLSGYGCWYQL